MVEQITIKITDSFADALDAMCKLCTTEDERVTRESLMVAGAKRLMDDQRLQLIYEVIPYEEGNEKTRIEEIASRLGGYNLKEINDCLCEAEPNSGYFPMSSSVIDDMNNELKRLKKALFIIGNGKVSHVIDFSNRVLMGEDPEDAMKPNTNGKAPGSLQDGRNPDPCNG